MFANHTRLRSFAETLVLTYSAKKRAEVAPGVGEATDMFTVGPLLGNCVYPVGDHVLEKLNAIHEDTKTKMRQSEQEANQVLNEFLQTLLQLPQQQQQPPTATPTPPASPNASSPPSEQSPPSV